MTKDIKKMKKETVRILEPLERTIKSALYETEDAFIEDFCRRHERRIITTTETIKSHITELNDNYLRLIYYKYLLDNSNFKNRLAAAIFMLEHHMDEKKSMDTEIKVLQKLGTQNEFVKSIANCLDNYKELKSGLDESIDLNKQYHDSINRAKLATFVRGNKGLNNYIIRFLAFKIFGKIAFHKNIEKFMLRNEELTSDLKRLSYMEEALKKRKYEDALNEIHLLSVIFL